MELPVLSIKESKALIELMKNPKITDKELASVLGVKSPNGARRYRKKLVDKGILVTKNTPRPEKLGFPIKFLVMVSGSSTKNTLEILKTHVLRAYKYLELMGEVIILPIGQGLILIKDILTIGEPPMGLIIAYATDTKTAHTYVDMYLPDTYPNIKADFKLIHSATVKDFLIDEKELSTYFSYLSPPEALGESIKNVEKFILQKKSR